MNGQSRGNVTNKESFGERVTMNRRMRRGIRTGMKRGDSNRLCVTMVMNSLKRAIRDCIPAILCGQHLRIANENVHERNVVMNVHKPRLRGRMCALIHAFARKRNLLGNSVLYCQIRNEVRRHVGEKSKSSTLEHLAMGRRMKHRKRSRRTSYREHNAETGNRRMCVTWRLIPFGYQ